ncbi:MAG: serine hydrolase domain-containing protein [Terracidiphilus sp.]
MRSSVALLAGSLLVSVCFAQGKKDGAPKPPQSIPELRQKLEKILQDTRTPGMSVAIVRREGPEWVAGLGKSDVASNHAATDETLFRIGSASKAFVSLSILKLANEGKLSLEDPVRKLVPEIWFENRWESTDPVRVVDLLEHTTGWDDMGAHDGAKDSTGMSLRECLDYDHHSRISRWRPGTRMSYSNSGPAVAAYIVEKIAGERYEDYVTQNFFQPIDMKTASYFQQPSPQLTTLYREDGKTAVPYWNILFRPTGAINASARDMAAYLQFYLNRGAVGGTQVMPAAAIDRMELPTRTWAAQQGLKTGYGLSNFWSIDDGFVYHGHDGGMEGGLTEIWYMPEYGVGYAYSINSGNGSACWQIGDAIRKYITRGLARPAVPAAASLPANAPEYAGWYEVDAVRNASSEFINRLVGVTWVRFEGGRMLLSDLGERDQVFVPVSGGQFRSVPKWGSAEPAATVMLVAPNAEGRFIQMTSGGEVTLKRIPAWMVFVEAGLVAWFVFAFVSILLYAPFWMIGGIIKKRRRPAERAIRLWPLVAVLSLLGFVTFFVLVASHDAMARMGNLTPWSVGIFLISLTYPAASLASAFALWRARNQQIRRSVRWYSIAVTSALLIAALYLAWWGVIGIRTWS